MWNLQHIFITCFFVMIIGVQQIHAENNEDISKLEKHYYEKCLKNTGTSVTYSKLRNDTFELNRYFLLTFTMLPNNRETFCRNERPNLLHRIKEVANDLKPCLMQDEKYLANFIKESFAEILHFFCHNNGEYTRRYFTSESTQCREKIEVSKTNDLDNCLDRIFAPARSYITQEEMCDDMTVARKCFTKLLEVNCPSSYDLKKLNEIFFDFLSKPCSSCIHLISSFMLVGSLLVHFFVNKF